MGTVTKPDDRDQAVQRMLDHVEAHLTEPITLVELARCARYSPWYAARLFKEKTGKSPFEYIRLRRLSAAARDLGSSSRRVIDVAFDFVFDSHEGFTRAFTRQFNVTPRAYRTTKPPVVMFLPERMRHYFRDANPGGSAMTQTIFVQVIQRPDRKLVLKRGAAATDYFEYCEEVGCDVWEQLAEIPDALHEPMGLWLPDRFRPAGTSRYVHGVEVPRDFDGALPDGFEVMDLPACMLMVFQGQPFADEEYATAIRSLWKEMEAYDPEIYGFAWDDEAGPRFQLEPRGYRGYIEGRPVRQLNPGATAV